MTDRRNGDGEVRDGAGAVAGTGPRLLPVARQDVDADGCRQVGDVVLGVLHELVRRTGWRP
jgi:hypothetical protein